MRAVRLSLAVAVVAAVLVLAVTHWHTVHAGGTSLARADKEWLLLALAATVAIFLAGAVTQLGSMSIRPPLGRLLAVQVAASFANNVLPAGAGGIGVNIRFLRKHGLGAGAAAGAVGLNSLAGLATHILLLVAAVAVSPSIARSLRMSVSWHYAWLLCVPAGALLLLASRKRSRTWLKGHALQLRGVLADPRRAAALWLGSLSTPLLHGVILFAVLRSLGVPLAVGTVVVVYLVVSSLSAVVPSPGGLGALDVTMLAGLAAVGVSPAVALGAVLGYRLITVWLPLLPGALALAVLLRRRII